jgi:hypothetical protein
MADWMGPCIRWAGGCAILGYAVYSFATHQDRVGALVSVVVGGYLIIRGFIRR